MNSDLITIINSIGFPITACIALGVFCSKMIENNNKNVQHMFDMYDKANEANRTAIQDVTAAVNRLCDKLDTIKG